MAVTGKIDVNITKVLIILIGVAALGVVSYLIYKHFKEKKEKDNVAALFAMEEFTAKGLATGISKIPKTKLKAVQSKMDAMDLQPIGNLIEDAPGTFNDDEESIYDAFSSLKTRLGIAYFAAYFKSVYKKPLLTFLQNFMNNEELSRLYEIIKPMPAYPY